MNCTATPVASLSQWMEVPRPTKKQRIEQLESDVAALKREIALLKRKPRKRK